MWFYELFSSNPRTLCGVAVAFSRHAIYTLVIAFCNHIREAQFPSIIMDFAVRVRNIAQHAINNINQLAGLVDQSSMRSPSNCEEESEQAATARPRPSPNQPNPSSGQASAVSELRQRFPTVNRGSRRRDQRPIPYSRAASARSLPGRPPASEIITRDVIIMEMACEKIPTKTERQALERSKRIISGFDFDRQWNDKKLYQGLQYLLLYLVASMTKTAVNQSRLHDQRVLQSLCLHKMKAAMKPHSPNRWLPPQNAIQLPKMCSPILSST